MEWRVRILTYKSIFCILCQFKYVTEKNGPPIPPRHHPRAQESSPAVGPTGHISISSYTWLPPTIFFPSPSQSTGTYLFLFFFSYLKEKIRGGKMTRIPSSSPIYTDKASDHSSMSGLLIFLPSPIP